MQSSIGNPDSYDTACIEVESLRHVLNSDAYTYKEVARCLR